jgi:hypothetical protein
VIFILHIVNKCDSIVISNHHAWMKYTSKCFFFQFWCQVTTQGFSKGYMLTVHTSDLGAWCSFATRRQRWHIFAELLLFLKSMTKIRKNNPKLKKKAFKSLFQFITILSNSRQNISDKIMFTFNMFYYQDVFLQH